MALGCQGVVTAGSRRSAVGQCQSNRHSRPREHDASRAAASSALGWCRLLDEELARASGYACVTRALPAPEALPQTIIVAPHVDGPVRYGENDAPVSDRGVFRQKPQLISDDPVGAVGEGCADVIDDGSAAGRTAGHADYC